MVMATSSRSGLGLGTGVGGVTLVVVTLGFGGGLAVAAELGVTLFDGVMLAVGRALALLLGRLQPVRISNSSKGKRGWKRIDGHSGLQLRLTDYDQFADRGEVAAVLIFKGGGLKHNQAHIVAEHGLW